MKNLTLLFAAIFCLILSSNATVHTVSNDINSPGQFTNITDAIAAASAGDTIYVHGTNFNYGSFTVDKQLTFIGSGHRPQNQNANVSIIDNVTMGAGSTGSSIIGFYLMQVSVSATGVSDIYVGRNMIENMVSCTNVSPSWIIEGNVFTSTGTNINQSFQASTNWRMVNNIFNGYPNSMNAQYNYFFNNIFLYNGNVLQNNVSESYFYNNIFYRASPSPSANSNVFSNNISFQCSNNAFNNGPNLEGVDPLFVDFPSGGASFDYLHDYNLAGGSPAANTGTDGTDMGVYGGTNGYFDFNGVPNIPQIREFTITSGSTIAPGSNIDINVKSTIKP